jgi:hypothetical protein
MTTIPVIWCFGNRGDRCHGLVEDALAGEFTPTCYHYSHHLELSAAGSPAAKGAVVVVSGGVQRDYVAEIIAAVERLSWALILITADEESKFDWLRLQGAGRKIWVQMPRGDTAKGCDRVFPIGYPYGTRQMLKTLQPECPEASRKHPWSFVGQMQHNQRRDCIETLDRRKDGGYVRRTAGFEQGYDKSEYLNLLMNSYLAPNPAGMYTTDCFRVWEALECGCLPVCDRRIVTTQQESYNYWLDLFVDKPPFPTLDKWDEFNQIANGYAGNPSARQRDMNEAMRWWITYKQNFVKWIESDLRDLECGVRRDGGTGVDSPHESSKSVFATGGARQACSLDTPASISEKLVPLHPTNHEANRRILFACNWHKNWVGCTPVMA